MKKIVAATLGASLLLATASCKKDILDENPQSVLTPGFLSTPQGIEAGVTGVYSGFRNIYGNEQGISLTEAGTDTWTNGIQTNSGLFDYSTTDLTPTNSGAAVNQWGIMYQYINDANGVLQYAATVQGLDPTRVKQLVAETKVLRAQYYFLLVQQFGDVPLQLNFVTTPTKDITRAPLADVYTAILADLNDALANIANTAAQPGRVTRATALHLLAKVYLTRATSTATQNTDYANAAKFAQELIDNQALYGRGLETDPANVFAEGNENGKEVLFNVQFNADPTFSQTDGSTYPGANVTNYMYRSRYDLLPNMVRDIPNGRPFARFCTTYYLENAYILRDASGNALETGAAQRTIDTRYNKWFTTVYRVNSPGNNSGSSKAVIGDTAAWYPGRELSAAQLARIAARSPVAYRVIQPSQYTTEYYTTMNKFDSKNRTAVNAFSPRPVIIYRLADTYLMAAEAYFYLSNTAQAAKLINVVRERAAATGKTALMDITPAQVNLDFILDERARELVGEQMRWLDLKRTGQLLNRVKLYSPPLTTRSNGVYGSNAALNIKSFHTLRPIPQTEVDRTMGKITQNPGY
ncbi:MAG: RagB/SusD family nutrient uptake outer membrane protein [Janthinobacterium lividum]